MKLFAVLSVLVSAVSAAIDPNSWLNVRYDREINLSQGYIQEIDTIQIKNMLSVPQAQYFFQTTGVKDETKLVSIRVMANPDLVSRDSLIPELVAPNTYRVDLAAPVAPNSVQDIAVSYIYLAALEAVPAKIELSDLQFLVWSGSKLPQLYYPTSQYTLGFSGMSQGMELKVPSEPDQYSVLTPRVEGAMLKYGPITETFHNATLPMLLRYDHPLPLKHVHTLNRSVWLPASPVALVQFEEYYELAHIGAKLTSGFSRLQWMAGRYAQQAAHWSLSWLDFAPNDEIHWDDSLYYHTDLVGKVSTPGVTDDHLIIQPRFPMFGGWNYNFTLGYEQPIGSVLHVVDKSPDTFIAKIPLVNTVTDMTYDDVTVNFYLPEGAVFLNVSSPLPYADVSVGTELSYLDVSSGHVKVSVRYRSLTSEQANDHLYVSYQYSAASYYAKLAKISGSVFAALAAYYLLGKISLDISP